MSKLVVAFVFAAVTVLTGAAHAVPLRITEGEIFANTVLTDILSDFRGNGFEVTSVNPGIFGGEVPIRASFDSGPSTVNFSIVTVGSLTCGTAGGPDADCGFIQTTHGPLPLDQSEPFDTVSAPFTAIGQLFVGGETFDIVGGGIVVGTWCRDPHCVIDTFFLHDQTYRYTFFVPEPPTLLLVVASFGVLGALFGARILRNRYAARLPQHPY